MYTVVDIDISNTKGVEKQLLQILRDELDAAFRSAEPNITEKFRYLLLNEIRNCKEFDSLRSNERGSLKGELGVVDPEEKINQILDIWSKQFYMTHHRFVITGSSINGGFDLEAIDLDYAAAGAIGQFQSEHGYTVEWLKYLTLAGDKVIISNYNVRFGTFSKSRTGLALMVKTDKEFYRVNSAFSGDENDNFVTRSFDRILKMVPKIIKEEIENVL